MKNILKNTNYLIIACVFLALGSIIFFSTTAFKPLAIDTATNCPIQGLERHTIFVVDKTDIYTENQIMQLRVELLKQASRLKRGERLSIYTIDDKDLYGRAPVFSTCSPGTGKEYNALYENPAFGQMKYEKKFAEPIEGLFKRLMIRESHPSSPILEDLQEISELADFNDDVSFRKILIVSDMMQNTKKMNSYQWSDQKLKSSAMDNSMTQFKEVDIEIIVVPRPKVKSRQKLMVDSVWPTLIGSSSFKRIGVLNI